MMIDDSWCMELHKAIRERSGQQDIQKKQGLGGLRQRSLKNNDIVVIEVIFIRHTTSGKEQLQYFKFFINNITLCAERCSLRLLLIVFMSCVKAPYKLIIEVMLSLTINSAMSDNLHVFKLKRLIFLSVFWAVCLVMSAPKLVMLRIDLRVAAAADEQK